MTFKLERREYLLVLFPSRFLISKDYHIFVVFCSGTQDDVEIAEITLDHQKNKTGDIWHVLIEVFL
jgi:hypothetical protein